MPNEVKGLPTNNFWPGTDFSSVSSQRNAVSAEKTAARLVSQGNSDTLKAFDHQKHVKESAKDFEALLLHQMVQSMWSSVPKEGLLSGSREEDLYRDMLSEEVSQSIAATHNLGIQEQIVNDINRLDKKTK